MLIRSKNKNEKIVWGLLSYTFDDSMTSAEQHEVIEAIKENPNYEIFLYKGEDSDNYIGVLVVEINKNVSEEIEMAISIHRAALLPSYRTEGLAYQMYVELRDLYPEASIQGSILMSEIVKNWSIRYREENQE